VKNAKKRAVADSKPDGESYRDRGKPEVNAAKIPIAPQEPEALPGHNTEATKYCSASSLKVRKPTTGR
jgi:hypothetical protein